MIHDLPKDLVEDSRKLLQQGADYEEFFKKALKKFGVNSPADFKSDEEKKKFFDYVDKNYKGEKDEEVQKLRKELFGLDEAIKDYEVKIKVGSKTNSYTIPAKDELSAAQSVLHSVIARSKTGGSPGLAAIRKQYPDMKSLKKKGISVSIKEEVEVKEGKMSQLHQLMKDGKTAEEIAKIMRVDAKTIKKLMGESYEIGTDEYRKHTEDVTPGENGEWAKHVGEKSQSMREALAKVWGVNEGKSPFKKEEKKSLTKEVKDGKTMTGKKIASVDINPTIKEKAK